MRRGGESVFVAVLILFSAASLWQAYGIAGFSKWSSPGVFPMLASATMLVCGLFVFRDNLKRRQHSMPPFASSTVQSALPGDSSTQPSQDHTSSVLPLRVVVLTVLLVLYVVAMPTLGFLLCSGLFLLASISYLWKKPLWLAVVVSVASLLVIHVVFRIVFQVILPRGTLIEMFF